MAALLPAAMWSANARAQDPAPKEPPAEIIVEGRKPAVQRTADGVSYDQRDNVQAQAGSAADMLATVQSVAVSTDGTVTLRGDANVQIHVNGRPTAAMTGDNRATTLQSMAGDRIASVEVMTNPSAGMDANGGAIINLILKQETATGPRATVSANGGDQRRASLAFDSSYGWDGLQIDLDAGYRDDVRLNGVVGDRRFAVPSAEGIVRRTAIATYSPTHRRTKNLSTGLRYDLTKATDIGASIDISQTISGNMIHTALADFDAAARELARYARLREWRQHTGSRELGFTFAHRGTRRRPSLNIEVEDGITHIRADRTFAIDYYVPSLPSTMEYVGIRSSHRLSRVAADVATMIADGLTASMGAEWKRSEDIYRDSHEALAPGSPFQRGFSGPATLFSLRQNARAFYVSMKADAQPWTVQGGLRVRIVGLHFSTTSPKPILDRSITGFNGNLSVRRSIGPGTAGLAMTRSQQLPEAHVFNPAIIYIDAQNSVIGNPALRPQEVTTGEMGYDLTHGRVSGSAKLYYRRTDRSIVDDDIALGGGILRGKRNAGRSQAWGVELIAAAKIGRTLRASATANLFHSRLTPEGEARLSWSGQASGEWSMTKKDLIRLDATVASASLVAQGRQSGDFGLNAVWRHSLWSRLSLSLTAQRFVQKASLRTNIATSTIMNSEKRRNGDRKLLLGLKYRLR